MRNDALKLLNKYHEAFPRNSSTSLDRSTPFHLPPAQTSQRLHFGCPSREEYQGTKKKKSVCEGNYWGILTETWK